MGLAELIFQCFKDKKKFTLKEAYDAQKGKARESIRARIYENLGIRFERVGKGVYQTIDKEETCLILEGDGRKLEMFDDNSIDCILTDHPWEDKGSNKGGNRMFSDYPCFRYELQDFREKARILKPGCFLVEILPSENENNYKYLFQLKQYAEECGLLYYAKVEWRKKGFCGNTGRKAKDSQDVMIFSKGKARSLRLDVKRTQKAGEPIYMSGTDGMLPAAFEVPPVAKKEKIHQSELPVSLLEKILEYVTKEGEIVLDTFAGSGSTGEAALNKKRSCILIETVRENIEKMKERFCGRNAYYGKCK